MFSRGNSRETGTTALPSMVLFCAAALLAGMPGRLDGLVVMSEDFRTATATAKGWTLKGNATLTSGGVDPAGAGWLRLTSASATQAGSAIFDTAFSSSDGAQITFSYATYGGNGADGISFYLIDGTAATTVGAPGGGLGYSRITDPTVTPGVTGGYLGVGLDEYGNFAKDTSGTCNPSCPGQSPNHVTIRGSGSLNTGFNYLTQQGFTIGTTDRAGAKRVRITVSPDPVTITVEIDSGSGFVPVISSFPVAGALGQVATPTTFKMGLSASTGGSNNYHEIRDLNLNGARPSTTTLVSSPSSSVAGQSVTFTATVTVTGAAGSPSGTVTFKDGATVLGSSSVSSVSSVTGTATLDTSALTVGTHSITATYSGDGIYASSLSSAVSQVVSLAASTTILASLPNPSPSGQSVTFTATVTGAAGSPTGTVTFRDGAMVLGSPSVASGIATLATSALTVGTHSITATYSGNATYSSSVSDTVSQVVANSAPTASSMNPASGPLGGGTSVTIFGTNFVSGATVTFGGTGASVATLSPTQIKVTTPAGAAAGAVAVKVTNPDTQSVTLAQTFTYNPSGCWPDTTAKSAMVGPCNPMVAGDPRDPGATPISPSVSPDGTIYQLPPLWSGVLPGDKLVFFTGAPPTPTKATGRIPASPAPTTSGTGTTGAYVETTGSGIISVGLFQGSAAGKATRGATPATLTGYGMTVTGYRAGVPTFTSTVALASSRGNGVFDRVVKSGDFDLPLVTMDADRDGFADHISAPWALIGTFLGGYTGGGAPGPTPQVWLPLADTDGDGYGDAIVFDFGGTGQPSAVIPQMPALLPPVSQRDLFAIPALGEWGLFALALSVAAAGWFVLRRTVS